VDTGGGEAATYTRNLKKAERTLQNRLRVQEKGEKGGGKRTASINKEDRRWFSS